MHTGDECYRDRILHPFTHFAHVFAVMRRVITILCHRLTDWQDQAVHRLHKLASLRLRQVYAHLLRGRFDAACINHTFLSLTILHKPWRHVYVCSD